MNDVKELLERLLIGLQNLRGQIPRILADPKSHPQEALTLAGIGAVGLLLLVLVGVLAFEMVQRARSHRALGVRRAPGRRLVVVVWGMALVLLLITAVALAPLVPAAGGQCGRCHAVSSAVKTWRADAHAGASCYACHARPGMLGALQASGEGLSRVLGTQRVRSAESGSCLKCHSDVLSSVVETSYLRVRHKEIEAAGIDCLTCHPGVGHTARSTKAGAVPAAPRVEDGSMPTSERSIMGRCLLCHDGDRASAECSTCHVRSTLDKQTEIERGGVVLGKVECDGCHSQKLTLRCETCHGLEMPHPDTFMREHARTSSKDPALCARCHESASAAAPCACHLPGETHGDLSRWFVKHSEAALTQWPNGCACHTESDCVFCHYEESRR